MFKELYYFFYNWHFVTFKEPKLFKPLAVIQLRRLFSLFVRIPFFAIALPVVVVFSISALFKDLTDSFLRRFSLGQWMLEDKLGFPDLDKVTDEMLRDLRKKARDSKEDVTQDV